MSAKAAFGKLKESISQTEYLANKNSKQIYCTTPRYCAKALKVDSYDSLYKFNNGLYEISLSKCLNIIPCNKGNLAVGLVSAMNLKNACEVISQPLCNLDNCTSCSTPIAMNVNPVSGEWAGKPFYQVNYTDPLGSFSGRTQCGELNWTRYLVYKPTNN